MRGTSNTRKSGRSQWATGGVSIHIKYTEKPVGLIGYPSAAEWRLTNTRILELGGRGGVGGGGAHSGTCSNSGKLGWYVKPIVDISAVTKRD